MATAVFLVPFVAGLVISSADPSEYVPPQDQPIGWASVDDGTQGGSAGEAVTVQDADALAKCLRRKEPLVIRVVGTIKLPSSLPIAANKTVLGLGSDAALVGGGLRLKGVSQVVIRNLAIRESPDDAISIEALSHHIWIDHCDLSRCHDGLLDIKTGSDRITVSWNHFHDHQKTSLVGHSDKPDVLRADKGKLRVTYHHNFFDRTHSRHPRVRAGGPVHVFNNYFVGNDYGVASVIDAGVVVEGNCFERVKAATHTTYGDSDEPGRLVERNNLLIESGPPATRGEVREPRESYDYRVDDPQAVKDRVIQGAGVGKIGL